jgi:HlyD family secretion protein
MKKKKIIIISIIAISAIVLIQQIVSRSNDFDIELFKVEIGNVYQRVSETGNIKSGEKINLGFKTSGTIENIYVAIGDQVQLNQSLIKLDADILNIQLVEAEANLEITQAQFDELIAGSTVEEITSAETTVENAKQSLANIQASAEETVNQSYESGRTILNASYSSASLALTVVTNLKRDYFGSTDQEGILVRAKEIEISGSLAEAENKINEAEINQTEENIDAALAQLKTSLEVTYNALTIIRETINSTSYKDVISSTDKTSLDTQKTNINTALTNVISAQQTISSAKISKQTNINTAEGVLRVAEDQLALITADPRQEDINLYAAQVKQAQAKVDILRNNIAQTTLRSPVHGIVTEINKRIGETVQPSYTDSVITILPANPYQIETNIYEEDIVKVQIGNLVEIELVAFPNQVFNGRVTSIGPAEELINGVVYYSLTIDFEDETPAGIKPGMTADIIIITDSRENVLIVLEDAILETNNKKIVKIYKDKEIEEREVEIGLIGFDGMVEIISGLEEGEEIVLD